MLSIGGRIKQRQMEGAVGPNDMESIPAAVGAQRFTCGALGRTTTAAAATANLTTALFSLLCGATSYKHRLGEFVGRNYIANVCRPLRLCLW